MKVTDCFWELSNIGTNTVEVYIPSLSELDESELLNLEEKYSYLVIKTPVNNYQLSKLLYEKGYVYIESQFNISKKFKSFDVEDRLVKTIFPHVKIERLTLKEEFDAAMENITPGMFSTDRIAIDPYFGLMKSRNRYVNWMKTEFDKQKAIFIKFLYDGKNVGVGMHKIENDILTGLVGGVYEKYQDEGLGILTPSAPFIYAHQGGDQFKKMITCISSNNMPVIQLYDYLGFKIDDIRYVFVKHIL